MEKPVLSRLSEYVIFISFTYSAKNFLFLSRKCPSVHMLAGLARPRRSVGSEKAEVQGAWTV